MRVSLVLLLSLVAVVVALILGCSSVDAASVTLAAPVAPYTYSTNWYEANLDNFDFSLTGRTFPMKYLVNATYYKPGGPIFFYTGNEGPIELFAQNTGFMWDQAPVFGAMLVFAEHRYYGASLPFGAESFTNANYAHLSAEQALADYALLLTSLKFNLSIPDAQVVSFGGSYGGMLSSWFRKNYPHIVVGAIAGSAPIWLFDSISSDFDPKVYNKIASDDFRKVSQQCFESIAASWEALQTVAASPDGLIALSEALGLCDTLGHVDEIAKDVYPWISNVYSSLPMGDYPYPAEFIAPLPGSPVNVTCSFFDAWGPKPDPIDLVQATRMTMDLFYNFTGQAGSCHNLTNEQGLAELGAGNSWPVQSCTEMLMPIGQYGPPSDLFFKQEWNETEVVRQCQEQFGFTPQKTWIMTHYGGPKDWSDATNIVFSNGDLDPWAGGGVLHNISATVVALPVIGGAHHMDLRSSHPHDPPGVVWAREQEVNWIRTFLANPSPASTIIYNTTTIYVQNTTTVYVYLNGTDSSDSGLTKPEVAIVSVLAAMAVAFIVLGGYAYCMAKRPQSLVEGGGSEANGAYTQAP